MNICPDRSLADLRRDRRQLSEAAARLCWLRRLVVARTDLEVARLTAVTADACELDSIVRTALDPGVSTAPDLLRSLRSTVRALDAELDRTHQALDVLTRDLVDRLSTDPAGRAALAAAS